MASTILISVYRYTRLHSWCYGYLPHAADNCIQVTYDFFLSFRATGASNEQYFYVAAVLLINLEI